MGEEKKESDVVIQEVIDIFEDDQDLLLFYLAWIKNGLNASKAYQELHKDVTEHSARTLGSRLLAKVDKRLVMQAYGLDLDRYFKQLREGLDAEKVNEFTGEMYPDHTTRKPYHDKLGKHLGLEKDKALIEFNQQNNTFVTLDKFMENIKKRVETEGGNYDREGEGETTRTEIQTESNEG